MEELIQQNFLRRRVGDLPKRFIKAAIQIKNIVAVFVLDEFKNFLVGEAGATVKSFIGYKKSVRKIFFVVQSVFKLFISEDGRGFEQIQRRLNKTKNFVGRFHIKSSFVNEKGAVANSSPFFGGK